MRRFTRLVAVVAAAMFLSVSGCSVGGSTGTDEKKSDNALSKIDPCKIIGPEKAKQIGLPENGEPDQSIPSEPGCEYIGDYAHITVHRVAEDSLDEYGNRSVWSEFKRLKINGRDGAEAHTPSETDDQCMTAISAGDGVVSVLALSMDSRKPFDACAESLKVAKLIEPDLPK